MRDFNFNHTPLAHRNNDSHIIHAHVASNTDRHDEGTTSFVERAVPVLSTIVSITIRIAISRLIGSPAMC